MFMWILACGNWHMEIGPFDIEVPDPPLRDPHAVVMLRPWINVGNVGAVVLGRLKNMFDGREIGRLRTPGNYYDFTRYRPEMKMADGERHVTVPNTVFLSARREEAPDLVLIHLLEPHSKSEEYNDVLERLGVRAYVTIGSMYDSVPHSRPLSVSGSMKGWENPPNLGGFTPSRSNYEGPTSMTGQISQMISARGVSTLNLMVRLPLYLQLDNDFAGSARIVEILGPMYGLGDASAERELGRQQYSQVATAVLKDPQLEELVERLEREYDDSHKESGAAAEADDDSIELSPEIERFLEGLRRKSGDDEPAGPGSGQ